MASSLRSCGSRQALYISFADSCQKFHSPVGLFAQDGRPMLQEE
jgi:hypothetical protein